ncbi:hypothetical protein AKJ37_04040 [candidate division MSBL1 archaeon SCGC-AAA259I09]|uniref:Uncharacterized protein n=1 Tax=candidate division MSBL1 archaeon SCGC-AAA259I09 TaxID=1698267 RepID=A0A133US42_9EURY|nr:hypothetical protein AKJ37_04040 [candidate division MSBL1 archaeon SCGC-AAA259I09]
MTILSSSNKLNIEFIRAFPQARHQFSPAKKCWWTSTFYLKIMGAPIIFPIANAGTPLLSKSICVQILFTPDHPGERFIKKGESFTGDRSTGV